MRLFPLKSFALLCLALLLSFSASGCTLSMQNRAESTATPAAGAVPAVPAETPAPTSVPAAAIVNGEPITIEEYRAELERYTAALVPVPSSITEDHKLTVIDDLVARLLLAQAAVKEGYAADAGQIQARIDALIQQAGGEDAWQTWLTENKYTPESYRAAYERDAAAAWMRDRILAAIPPEAEQVHARQMLFSDRDAANEMAARLQAGESFADLAQEIDPTTGGDMGWFPRHFLLLPELDAVFFGSDSQAALEADQTSPVIQTRMGYHIFQTIEREPQRPLSPLALRKAQAAGLAEWIHTQQEQSTIEISLPD